MIVIDDRKLYYAASAGLHQLCPDCLLSPASTKTFIQGKAVHGHGQGLKGLLEVTCVCILSDTSISNTMQNYLVYE